MSEEHRQRMNRLRAYAQAIERADDKGHMASAAPLYSALALIEIARSLTEISEQMQAARA